MNKSVLIGVVALLIAFVGVSVHALLKDSMPVGTTVIENTVSMATTSQTGMDEEKVTLGAETIVQEKSAGDIKNTEDVSLRTDVEWKNILTPDQYAVLREGGTETPFTSPLVDEKRPGTYVTADCGEPVFRSEQKFETGTGWPSFYAPINAQAIVEVKDTSGGMSRTEIMSTKCKSHLGHVFNDAPQTPTGLRYCMNGVALRFIPD